jgi:hypothetical protein
VSFSRQILLPKKVPLLTTILNGVLARIWPLSHLCLTWWLVARPKASPGEAPVVSVVVPCRNEAGMIGEILARVPELGAGTEVVFVEGGSTDGTREEIERQIAAQPERDLTLLAQTGTGKARAATC